MEGIPPHKKLRLPEDSMGLVKTKKACAFYDTRFTIFSKLYR
jgi:hypothetical protein